MLWTKEKIIEAIEGYQWDHEESFNIPEITEVNLPHIFMRKQENMNSIYANKVMKSIFDENKVSEQIEYVFDFFKDKAFTWWIGPTSKPNHLKQNLIEKGLEIIDEYVGLAFNLVDWNIRTIKSGYQIEEVDGEIKLQEHVNISAEMWDLKDKGSIESLYKKRFIYLNLPNRRGGFIVALHDEKGIGNANYRLSSDGKVMHLTGSAVLPKYRNQGVYHDLLYHRLNKAKQNNIELVTVQARKGVSEPILRKIGFKEYGNYIVLKKTL